MLETKGCIIAPLSINLHSSPDGQGHLEQHWAPVTSLTSQWRTFSGFESKYVSSCQTRPLCQPALSATQTDIKETKVTKTLLTRAEEVPEPSQETARKSVTELFRFADTRHTLNIWQRGNVWKSQFDLNNIQIHFMLGCSWQWMTSVCTFFNTHKTWFIHFQSWEITSLYFLWRSRWSVLWFPSWQKYYLSNLSGKYPDNIPPSLHLHCTLATTLASSNQTNCPQTASYNLGTNLPKMSLQFSCHNARFCSLLVFSLLLHSESLPVSQISVGADFNESNQEIRGLTDTW